MLIEALVILGVVAVGVIYKYRQGSGAGLKLISAATPVPITDPLCHRVVWVKYLENIGAYGRQTAGVFDANNRIFDLLVNTLNSKFSPSELTYQRYYNVIEMTFRELRAAVENILPVLEGLDISGQNKQALQRSEQVEGVLSTCDRLNESLDLLLTELSKLSNFDQQQNADVEDLLKNLQDLSNRVKNYAI